MNKPLALLISVLPITYLCALFSAVFSNSKAGATIACILIAVPTVVVLGGFLAGLTYLLYKELTCNTKRHGRGCGRQGHG